LLQWQLDANVLFFVGASGNLTSVTIAPGADGPVLGEAVTLFSMQQVGAGAGAPWYPVARGGGRFLAVAAVPACRARCR